MSNPSLSQFVGRHIGPRPEDVTEMLTTVGMPDLDALCDAAVPGAIRQSEALGIEAAPNELAVLTELRTLAARHNLPAFGEEGGDG